MSIFQSFVVKNSKHDFQCTICCFTIIDIQCLTWFNDVSQENRGILVIQFEHTSFSTRKLLLWCHNQTNQFHLFHSIKISSGNCHFHRLSDIWQSSFPHLIAPDSSNKHRRRTRTAFLWVCWRWNHVWVLFAGPSQALGYKEGERPLSRTDCKLENF